jgi:glycosyltransferase involved in cell wall biosynthesis
MLRSPTECRQQLGLSTQGQLLVYVGNLLKTKGCYDLLESFAQLRQQRLEAMLVYVGSGSAGLAYMQARADALGIRDAVQWVGTQPHEQVSLWMGAADVVVLPSYNEGVPNVLLEAMACGRPIVATRVGGIAEVVPEFAGLLVTPGDIPALTVALHTALTSRWSTETILAHIRQFTWERNITQLQAVLERSIYS